MVIGIENGYLNSDIEEDKSSEFSKPRVGMSHEGSKHKREDNDSEEESDENSDTTINTGDAEFHVSDEKWNIVLGKLEINLNI